ncbi:hypothetical protein PR048_002590 [Dryococelus australis]|uniref:Uncharacterized protein n=1 Tax=Dryococelus australis TaxID=614101 RepID=A0ABQ9IKM9_9NEOP|nr:hypothetical protein PR048_002590 [Dryococelus australis]
MPTQHFIQKRKNIFDIADWVISDQYEPVKIDVNSFKPSETGAEELIGFVHSDLCGPMEEPSIGGKCYFLTHLLFERKEIANREEDENPLNGWWRIHQHIPEETANQIGCSTQINCETYATEEWCC